MLFLITRLPLCISCIIQLIRLRSRPLVGGRHSRL